MSDYTQTVDFSAKDALPSGDVNKKVMGADVDTELAAIATAISSKLDEDFTGLTEDTNPDAANDLVATYDNSAGVNKKVKLTNAFRMKVGSFTRDSSLASGTQSVTGVGFKPRAILFLSNINSTNQVSAGISDGTTEGYIAHHATGSLWTTSSVNSIVMIQDSGITYSGAISSFDSDGFTITWTKSGAKTGTITIKYLALG